MLPKNSVKLPASGYIKKQPIQFATVFLHFDYFYAALSILVYVRCETHLAGFSLKRSV